LSSRFIFIGVNNIRLFKSKQLDSVTPEDAKLLIDFVQFASKYLKFEGPFTIRMLHAAPNEAITMGCYAPGEKKISVVVEKRNPLDYFRTIAHEMVHQKQQSQGEFDENGGTQEIGGKIEDTANALAGRIVKKYIKTHLQPEQKKRLGLGTY
jgi:hypothetical protein